MWTQSTLKVEVWTMTLDLPCFTPLSAALPRARVCEPAVLCAPAAEAATACMALPGLLPKPC